jgi:hypothetical protein
LPSVLREEYAGIVNPDLPHIRLALAELRAEPSCQRCWFLNRDVEHANPRVLAALGRLAQPEVIRQVARALARRHFSKTDEAILWIEVQASRFTITSPPNLADHLVAVAEIAAERDHLNREDVLDSLADAYREWKVPA